MRVEFGPRPYISPEEYQDFRVCSLKSWATFMLSQNGKMPDPETLLQTLLRDAEQAKLFAPGISNRQFMVTSPHAIYEFRGFVYEAEARLLQNKFYSKPCELTHKEGVLFEALIAHAPHALALDYLEELLGYPKDLGLKGNEHHAILHSIMNRTRAKIGDYMLEKRDFFLIRSRWGVGVRFDPVQNYGDLLKDGCRGIL